MRVRRCGLVMLEPAERLEFDLARLAAGGSGLYTVMDWIAFVPHAGKTTTLTAAEATALGELSPSQWIESADVRAERAKQSAP